MFFYFIFDALDSVASSKVWAGKILRILIGEHKIQVNFQSESRPGWNHGTELKEVLINKVFDLGHYKNIKKIRKTINPIVQTVQLCTSKHSTERSKDSRNTIQKWEESNLTNSGNLAEFISHRTEWEDKNLENYLQNTKWMPY